MQKIPISQTWTPLLVGAQPADLNALGVIMAAQLSAYISANVSFFFEDVVDPTAYVTDLFYNTAQRVFKGWDTGTGRYLPITQFNQGDVKLTFLTGDSPTTGWIVCDGRAISAVPNLSAYQVAVLQGLFGPSGSLPNVRPLTALQNLPTNGAFSGISNPVVAPPKGQIGGLTFSSPPAQSEVQALATNSETLDESVIALQAAVAAIMTESESVLNSLNGSGPTMQSMVFVGFP